MFLFFFAVGLPMLLCDLFNDFDLLRSRSGMDLGVEFGVGEEVTVVFHELATSFFVQTAFGEGDYQQTLDHFENVG